METVAKVVSIISGLLSAGSSLKNLFDPSSGGIDLQQLTDMIVNEVKVVFQRDLTLDQIKAATASAQSASQFVNEDYAADVNAGYTDDQLYAALTSGLGANALSDAEDQINLMAQWTDDGQADLAQQTISLYLLLGAIILGFYQEMARRSTGDVHNATLATIKARAATYYATAQPLVAAVQTARLAAISGLDIAYNPYTNTPRQVTFTDSWLSGDPVCGAFYSNGAYSPLCTDPLGAVTPVLTAYVGLVSTGDATAASALKTQVYDNSCTNGYAQTLDYRVDSVVTYGTWYANCLTSLANFAALKTNPLGGTSATHHGRHRPHH